MLEEMHDPVLSQLIFVKAMSTQVSYQILGRGYFSTSLFAGYKYTEIEGRGSHLK